MTKLLRSILRQGGWLGFKGGNCRRSIALTLSTAVTNYNIRVQAGNPTDPVDVVLTITAAGTARGLLTGSGWHPESTISVINQGNIQGNSGNPGAGASVTASSVGASPPGDVGGDAFALSFNVTIDNASGNIFGGGGGGGGGGAAASTNPPLDNQAGAGGGGGAGRGHSNNSGGPQGTTTNDGPFPAEDGQSGSAGNSSGAGAGGNGGSRTGFPPKGGTGGTGGDWGTDGSNGADGIGTFFSVGGVGGAAGRAISLNGFTATITAGNNGAQIKGAIS
jgi:hypothetical protein